MGAGDAGSLTPGRRRRRRWLWAAGMVAFAFAAFVLYWFQPQKLFIDDRVDEAIPTVTAGSATEADPTSSGDPGATTPETTTETVAPPGPPAEQAEPAEPAELARGEFISRDHGTSGAAIVLRLADGSRILRLEDLNTDNGPDLYVYLTATAAGGEESAFDDDFVNLGRLKGNIGNQNYDLPADVDLSRYASVVIWCDRFNSAFGAADLKSVR